MSEDIGSDSELWASFAASSLPAKAWTHEAHLRIAFLLSKNLDLDEAHLLMRVGIIKLNAAHGLVETMARGYHETMTRVWLALVKAAVRETPTLDDSKELIAAHATRFAKDAPTRFYSRDRLLSREARARFVEPDLARLP